MSLAQLIPLAINASMFAIVFALGLRASPGETISEFRRPGLLLRSILAMNVVMLVFAVAAALSFELPPALEIAIVAIALSPVPPVLPAKQEQAGGSESTTIGLLVAAALAAVLVVPIATILLGYIFGQDFQMPLQKVTTVVVTSVIVPLVLGIGLRLVAPEIARKIARPLTLIAMVLLVIAVVPVLFTAWPAVQAMVGNGVVVLLILFTVIGIAVGHLLGGPDPGDRAVLALATGTRHPGVAIAIAGLNFPEEKAVFAVVFFHLVIGAIASIPYVMWRKRAQISGETR